jgi:hypothetical protein
VEALSSSLSRAGGDPQGLSRETKSVKISYDPSKVTLHQLAQVVLETEPLHGKRYEPWLVVNLELPKEDPKIESKAAATMKRVKGVARVDKLPKSQPGDGEIGVLLAPLARQARPSDFVKASQIAEALEKSGVKFTGLPAAAAGGSDESDPKKKKTAAKSAAKSKGNDDEPPAEKPKSGRPSGLPKTKPTREPVAEKAPPGDLPRFQIVAISRDRVYLADNEAKIKKFVKEGDEFGEFLVKEAADKDGWYVVLEHRETGESIRIEKDPKDKPKEEASKRPEDGSSSDSREKKERDSAPPPAKTKDTKPADTPRFQILGEAGGKVYLADNEAKLKKLVKAGDMFGDFTVKEVEQKEGNWFVVLENPQTKETVRVEKEPKDSPKDDPPKESPKDDSESKKTDQSERAE